MMVRMKQAVLAGVCVLMAFSVCVHAAEPKGVLPGEAIVEVQTAPMNQMLGDLDAFVQSVGKGLPMPTQPGQVRMGMFFGLQLPEDVFDLTKPMSVYLFPGKGKPRMAMLLPIDLKKNLDGLKAQGYAVTSPMPGVHGLKHERYGHKGSVYVASLDKGWTIYARRADDAAYMLAEASNFSMPKADKATSLLRITLDVAKILLQNKAAIDGGFAEMKAEMEKQVKSGAAPVFVRNISAFVPAFLDDLRKGMDDVKSLRLYVYADSDRLRLNAFVTPQKGSTMRKVAQLYEPTKPSYAQLAYLPEGGIAFAMQSHKEGGQAMRAWAANMVAQLIKATGMKDTKAINDLIRQSMDLSVGETCGTVKLANLGEAPSGVYYMTVPDGEAYIKTYLHLMKQMTPLIDAMFSSLGTANMAGMIKMEMKENVGKVDGVPYHQFQYAINETADPAAKKTGMDAQMQQAMAKMLGGQAGRVAQVGNTIVIAAGADSLTDLTEAVKALKAKTPRLGKSAMFQKAFKADSSNQIGFAMMYLLDLVKMQLSQMAAFSPDGGQMIQQAIMTMPPATTPVSMTMGVQKESFRVGVDIPTKAISETVMGSMSVMMMMQAGSGGLTPPTPPSGSGGNGGF